MPNDGTLTLGICSRNVGDSTNPLRGNISVEMARTEWGGARALGLPITMHTSGASPITLPWPWVCCHAWDTRLSRVVLPDPAGPTRTSTLRPEPAVITKAAA